MKKLINAPDAVVPEMLAGLAYAYPQLRKLSSHNVLVRADLDPTHRYYQKAVTERRADGRWYVIDTNQCESWTE